MGWSTATAHATCIASTITLRGGVMPKILEAALIRRILLARILLGFTAVLPLLLLKDLNANLLAQALQSLHLLASDTLLGNAQALSTGSTG